ncbi:MAG: hypothetical protein CMB80_10800 [Flammeovirgaceae bacterium]|nr:hypothetical protein [Flammeovirgaceae bacterium]
MTFLNPQAFWGLSLLIIPILIHLFSFRWYKKVLFSNLAFLTEIKDQKQSSSTIKKVLILISRLLLLFFLIVAFAQPILQGDLQSDINKERLVYFDNSLSLQQVDDSGEPVLFRSYTALLNVLGHTEIDFKVLDNQSLIDFNGDVNQLSSIQEFSPEKASFERIKDKTELYAISDVLMFSDFQKNSFDLDRIADDTLTSYKLYQSLPKQQNNLFIDTLYLTNDLSYSDSYTIQIRVKNIGNFDVSDALVRLVKEGRQLVSKSLNIVANGYSSLELELKGIEDVYGEYQVELSDVPVVFDNVFSFYLKNPNAARIVLLEEDQSKSGDYLQTLFTNTNYFQLSRERVSSTSVNQLMDADFVILSELSTIPDWLIKQLDEIKGSVLVIPAGTIDYNSYNQLTSSQIYPIDQANSSPISSEVINHPLLKGVLSNDDQKTFDMPNFEVSYGLQGYFESILQTNEGHSVLAQIGNDNLYFFLAPLSEETTDLPKHALFVPVMYKLAQSEIQSPPYYRLNESYVELLADSINGSEAILTLTQGESIYYPSFRFSSQGLVFEIPEEITQPGIYYLVNQYDTLGVFAFNYAIQESEIECYSMEELSALAEVHDHITYQAVTNRVLSNASMNMDQESNSLWKYALLLALTFILIESILLRFLK